MASLERQSINSSREIRQVAITHLQRVLLGQYILLEDADPARAEEAFNRIVFPLVDGLLKPEVFDRDPAGMPETRLRAASLLCKAFMQLEVKEGESQTDIRVVWIQVLDLLDRLMNINRQDQLVCIRIFLTIPDHLSTTLFQYEAIPETLKNVILVMNAAELLVPPSEPDLRTEKQQQMWATTEERLERFLPKFLGSVLGAAQGTRSLPS
jgi:brefeldin A-resistance guanine nucleotide exchange factor 1